MVLRKSDRAMRVYCQGEAAKWRRLAQPLRVGSMRWAYLDEARCWLMQARCY